MRFVPRRTQAGETQVVWERIGICANNNGSLCSGGLQMSNVPDELRYAETHEWVRTETDGSVTVGISDHAQEQLGDLVYVELPDAGRVVAQGEEIAVVESVKAASDVYSPLSGEVTEVNEALADTPETVNSEPYVDGWLFKLKPSDPGELESLLDAEHYAESIVE